MKLSVLGAGAIGSIFGGLIRHHDSAIDLVLIGRGEHGQRMREKGQVVLDGPWGRRRVAVRVSGDVADLAGSDYVLLTVKSQGTEETIRAATPHLGRAVVISIQNGINQNVLSRFVQPDRLVLGMTATNMAVLEPGSVSLQLDGATVLGCMPGVTAAEPLEGAVALLRKTGLRVDPHPNVQGVQYNKLAINVLGYASVLSASNFITEALLHQGWRQTVGLPLLEECIETFRRAGILLARIPGVPDVHRLRLAMHGLNIPLVGGMVRWIARSRFDRRPIVFSLQQDLLRRKTTEIDYINGEVVRLARQHGGAAPRNALVVDLVRELEARGDGTFFSRDEVIERFRALAG